jgi:hypothetical protein
MTGRGFPMRGHVTRASPFDRLRVRPSRLSVPENLLLEPSARPSC